VNEGTEHLWKEEDFTAVNHLGYQGIESQNFEGIVLHRMLVNKEISDAYGYTPLFDLAFSDLPKSERYNNETASLAISAYIRTLITNRAPFQDWLKGDSGAMTEQEKRGAMLFFDKARCYTCHTGPSLNAMQFYALGVKDIYELGGLNTSADDPKNLGRGGFTGKEEDLYKFKVPQLYNLKEAPFFFHGSSKETISDVVDFFDKGMPENPNVPETQISSKFVKLNLSESEKKDLVAFLENGLHDPYMQRYVPPYIKSGNCFPNNDPVSIADMHCE
jgi:cytochrome c peroxidase